MVGHSYGGLCAQHYASVFPELIAGVVLVDSTSVDLKRLNALSLSGEDQDSDENWIEKCQEYGALGREQLERELAPKLEPNQTKLSSMAQTQIIRFLTSPALYQTMASEIQSWEKCAEAIKQMNAFPQVPLLVIGRDPDYTVDCAIQSGVLHTDARAIEEVWQELIDAQTQLSCRSRYLRADQSSHNIHLDRPDVVAQAILSLM